MEKLSMLVFSIKILVGLRVITEFYESAARGGRKREDFEVQDRL